METKPFSLQSPEIIAKDYGGNKQKIAQAMQMGMIDPTAGLLAGMFIDRIRSASQAEAAPTSSVAQDVMAPQPAQPAPMGGMPPQGAPPPPAGGLGALPVPDQMFDGPEAGLAAAPQPDDGMYAEGGKIEDAYTKWKRAIIKQESGGRYGIANAEGSGAMGLGQVMPDTAKALAKKLGLPYRPDLMAGSDEKAREYQDAITEAATREAWDYGKGDVAQASGYYFAGPNKAGWKGKTAQYMEDIQGRMGAPAPGAMGDDVPDEPKAELDTSTRQGRYLSADDHYRTALKTLDTPTPMREELDAYYAGKLDPEAQKARKKQDMWQALAQMGFGMASSQSPYFLQAVGDAGKATMPGVQEAAKERRTEEMQARAGRAGIEDRGRQERERMYGTAAELAGKEVDAEYKEKALTQQGELTREGHAMQERLAAMELAAKERVAALRAKADAAGGASSTDVQAGAAIYLETYLARKRAKIKDPRLMQNGVFLTDAELQKIAFKDAARDLGKTEPAEAYPGMGGEKAAPSKPQSSGNEIDFGGAF